MATWWPSSAMFHGECTWLSDPLCLGSSSWQITGNRNCTLHWHLLTQLCGPIQDPDHPRICQRGCNMVARDVAPAHMWLNTQSSPPLSDVQCFVDASTSFGIGIFLEGRVHAWALKPGWKSAGRDIGWAEMIAVELALLALADGKYHDCSVIIHSDNQDVISAFKAGRSCNSHQNAALQRIQSLRLCYNINVTLEYVNTNENQADAPSQGDLSVGACLPLFDIPPYLSIWLKPVP
jgi:hypothetical protein